MSERVAGRDPAEGRALLLCVHVKSVHLMLHHAMQVCATANIIMPMLPIHVHRYLLLHILMSSAWPRALACHARHASHGHACADCDVVVREHVAAMQRADLAW